MRIPQNYIQKVKAGIHGLQAFCIFIAGCLSLAVFTKSGGIDGSTGYMFALCFVSIIPLIYLIMVPMWSRAWRFANVYAYASLDVLCSILWLAAFSAVATWNKKGIEKGKNEEKDDSDSDSDNSGSCSNFAYGSASRCKVSKASVGFGVVICLLFIVTSILSIHAVIKYRRTGELPNGKQHGKAEQLAQEDYNKDPWSTDLHEPDEDEEEQRQHSNPFGDHANSSNDTLQAYGQLSQQDEYDAPSSHGMLHAQDTSYRPPSRTPSPAVSGAPSIDPHPGRQMSYGGPVLMPQPPQIYEEPLAPSALSPTGAFDQNANGRLSFPQGNYHADFR
ncbi:hypothetical protein KC363_g934 [Hortaea werneckii]|uniref:MARVEL domain-containing protein n=1 Tax=Hortaea werneckii TaxID=91943 RepID=A0A3M7FDY7_HORWE|nr:hypothetical protein KC356_g1610 [Hortaea werneckii]KAI7196254.1 hypothetical protein KC363_g934 [Hortaea werneckii]KAI7514285.1 hypothetical protein KC347_g625 [Hortaea werneckii]RMY87022.1 hypothetical protein D0861_05618 [Hortaea werneckii]